MGHEERLLAAGAEVEADAIHDRGDFGTIVAH
jgi:hypothetical protein